MPVVKGIYPKWTPRHKYKRIDREPTDKMIEAALASTAAFKSIEGSQLTVNREKMRIRFRAMWDAAVSK